MEALQDQAVDKMESVEPSEPSDVKFVSLSDGRKISYRELGVTCSEAKHQVLVLHGLGSSRIAGIPGASEEFLKSRHVRAVAIDRPGTGQSDIHYQQTFNSVCSDLEFVMDVLNMGSKVWFLGISCGGAYSWAAAYYIPHRVAGLILYCPVGNFQWKSLSKNDLQEITNSIPQSPMFKIARYFSIFISALFLRFFVAPLSGQEWLEAVKKDTSKRDQEHLTTNKYAIDLITRDGPESYKRSRGYGMAKDLQIVSATDWGFELTDIPTKFKGPIHIWQGDKDHLVPLKIQQWIKSQIPEAVALHVLPGEGHLSMLGEELAIRAFIAAFDEPFAPSHEPEIVTLSTSPLS